MSSVATKVLTLVNVSYGQNLSVEALADKISDPASVENCDASAFCFYSEVSDHLQEKFLEEMKVDMSVASRIAKGFSNLAGYSMALAG